jgi:hypothetical protein
MSQLDLLTVYKKFYVIMSEFFIITRRYNLQGIFIKFVDLLLEYDMVAIFPKIWKIFCKSKIYPRTK